jgi:hypothetical protein
MAFCVIVGAARGNQRRGAFAMDFDAYYATAAAVIQQYAGPMAPYLGEGLLEVPS